MRYDSMQAGAAADMAPVSVSLNRAASAADQLESHLRAIRGSVMGWRPEVAQKPAESEISPQLPIRDQADRISRQLDALCKLAEELQATF